MAFLAFEGLDGSGKSTLIRGLADYLQSITIPYLITREPGGTDLGEEIRSLLLRTEGETPSPRTELLLYQAGRAQHVDQRIRPALNKNQWVLCDRYTASTVAFQSGARGLNPESVKWLNDFASDGCQPDLWILLDLPVTQSIQRLHQREASGQGEKDRFEREAISFHQRVRESYLEQARAQAEQWLVLDGNQVPNILLQSLLAELRKKGWLAS